MQTMKPAYRPPLDALQRLVSKLFVSSWFAHHARTIAGDSAVGPLPRFRSFLSTAAAAFCAVTEMPILVKYLRRVFHDRSDLEAELPLAVCSIATRRTKGDRTELPLKLQLFLFLGTLLANSST